MHARVVYFVIFFQNYCHRLRKLWTLRSLLLIILSIKITSLKKNLKKFEKKKHKRAEVLVSSIILILFQNLRKCVVPNCTVSQESRDFHETFRFSFPPGSLCSCHTRQKKLTKILPASKWLTALPIF